MNSSQRAFFYYCLFIMAIYVVTGFYGVLWISDEFSWERSIYFVVVAIPVTVLFFMKCFFQPHWLIQSKRWFIASLLILIFSYGWGHFLWINAVSNSRLEVDSASRMAYWRGGLDWLYRPRW